jgi:hypothetical protein
VSIELATAPIYLAPWQELGFVARGKRPIFGCWSAQTGGEVPTALHFTAADEDE